MNNTIERRLQRLEDYWSILELKNRYCNACDGGWDRPSHDQDGLIELFTEDAVWDGRPALPLAQGRVEILETMESFRPLFPFIIHNVINPIIEIDGDSAHGHWHAILHYRTAKGAATTYSIYEDRFIRTGDGWRINSLRVYPTATVQYREAEVRTRFEEYE